MKIYTKTGDKGETSLYGGKRVLKSDLRLECYGTIDELNSCLGLTLALPEADNYREFITSVQNKLFNLGAELANPVGIGDSEFISEGDIELLEQEIDRLQTNLPALQNFILPGGSELSARFHMARTFCRRAERAAVRLNQRDTLRPETIKYLNRLSDLLFVVARHANFKAGETDAIWKK